MCGLCESALGLAWRRFGNRVHDPDLWLNWNAPWLAPLSLATFFVGLGLLAGLARRMAPRATARLLPRALVALGALSALGSIPGLYPWAVAVLVAGLALRLGSFLSFDSNRFHRLARASLPFAAMFWLVLFVATGLLPATRELRSLAFSQIPPKSARNVLLVVLDTVRADNLSLHGYDRATSPNLEAWSRRGVRFAQARATTSFTLGTHASLFTGYPMSRTSARVNAPLDGSRRTLAEHFRDRGYATAGFVGNIFYGSAHYGLDRGFLRYHDIPENITRRVTLREFARACRVGEYLVTWFERKWRILVPMQRLRLEGGELNREALAWVTENQARGRPFFLFLNYFDAHWPYTLPGEATHPFSRLTPDRLEARYLRLQKEEERHETGATTSEDAGLAALRIEVNSLYRDAYDDGIAWADRKLDELLGELERRGILKDTLVVVTSDHGEMLGEHGLIGHGNSLHRQVVHVPLLVLGARGMRVPAGSTVAQPVSLRDVPATILDLVGDPEPEKFPGRSLRKCWEKASAGGSDTGPVVSELEHMPWLPRSPRTPAASGPMWLLTEGRWSYHRRRHETLGTQEWLFDLLNDAGEEHNLAAESFHAATLDSLRRQWELARDPAAGG